MGYPSASTTGSTKTLRASDTRMSSQVDLNDEEGGKRNSAASKILNIVKSIWSTRELTDTTQSNDIHVKTTLRELIIYILYLVVLCILSFGMANPINYYYNQIMTGLLTGNGFSDMQSMDDFWSVMSENTDDNSTAMLDSIYWETWYNGDNATADEIGSIYYENKVLGVPRLRQLRVRNDPSKVHKNFVAIVKSFFDAYSSSSESTDPFGNYMNSTAFNYTPPSILKSSSLDGLHASYGGGGYVQDLTPNKDSSLEIMKFLQSNGWLDRGTRAVFLDFTVYNANINLFCQVRLLAEFPPTGGVFPSSTFRTVKLIRYVTSMDYFVLACEVFFIIFILYYTVEEALEIRIHKLKYFTSSVWNILDVIVILTSYVCIAFNVYRMMKVSSVLDSLLTKMDQFIDFEFLCFWQLQFNNAIALTVFLSWIKIFKYISFNKTMTQLTSTLAGCAKDIVGFGVMFNIVFMAYAQLGYLLFGSLLADYSTLTTTFFTLFRVILGDFDFVSLESNFKVLGPIYFISYVFFVFFVLLNMFLAIINDTYSEVKNDIANQKSDIEIGAFFKKGYDKMLSKMNIKRDKIVDIKNAINFADSNGDNKLDLKEWRTELKARGYSDIEIEEYFSRYDKDGDGVLELSEQNNFKEDLNNQSQELDKQMEEIKDSQNKADAGQFDEERQQANLVSNDEFNILTKRVDTMELSIGNLITRIDSVLTKLQTIESAKLKRREAMSNILDAINDTSSGNDAEKKRKLENMIRDELENWDDSMLASRGNSATIRVNSARKSAY